ncbi:MAG: hypothetical protein N3A66_11505, partial [Planctomycetota bacterium]|nr:hypothetical protein [Planctomycetota bacterium]
CIRDSFGGPPRQPETLLTQRDMDLAASIQQVCEEIVLLAGRHVHKETGIDRLCLAGGVALNCVANGRLLREGPFRKLWIQPAAGDAGGAVGAALFGWYQILQQPRVPEPQDSMRGALLGPRFSPREILSYLDKVGARYRVFEDETLLFNRVAHLLNDGKVIGLFQGRMEFGPRALGNRSIIGDARNPTMQANMNVKIKFRESFRPFAPSCLEERLADYFDLDCPSPYMLLVAPVRADRRLAMTAEQQRLWGIDKLNVVRSDIPAVTHVDYSARIQTVNREVNPRYYRLIKAFEEMTGCGVIVNTSFNIRGEPIVCSPEDAYKCFMYTDMDALVLENILCLKEEQPPLAGAEEYKKRFKPD